MSDTYSDIYKKANNNKTLINTIFEITTKCNWKCKHCYIPFHDNKGPSIDKIFDIFSQLRMMGCFDLSLTGGEIFCREDIMDIIRKAREMNFNLTLLTNVSLLNEDKIKELKDLFISLITCTIFSLDDTVHDSITGIPGSLEKAMNNIMLIKKHNIPLEIKTILMKTNYNSYKNLYTFCENNNFFYKVDAEVFSKNNGDSSPQQLKLSKDQMHEVILDIDKLRDYNFHKHSSDELICPIVNTCCSIDSKGDVYPCNKYFVKIGNIFDNNIKEIWHNNPLLDKIRDYHWSDLPHCINCENNEFCYRCPGVALLEDKDLLGISSLACEFASIRSQLY